jgi:hypothetical protein
MKKVVAYFHPIAKGVRGVEPRVQRREVERVVAERQLKLIKSFSESVRPSNPHRPVLTLAIEFARVHRASVIVARFDYLGRDLTFMEQISRLNAEVIACDKQDKSNSALINWSRAVTLDTRVKRSRIRKALSLYKAEGGILGNSSNLSVESASLGRNLGAAAMRDLAFCVYEGAIPIVRDLHRTGMSLRKIAEQLNGQGIPTLRRTPWNAMQVKRVLDRYAEWKFC